MAYQKKICIYTCIASITIDSVMKINKQKYRLKKTQMPRLISTELDSNSESDSEAESKSDTKLMAKLKSDSDSD